jgi:phage-related holin
MVIYSAVNTVAVVYETVKSVLEESVKDQSVVFNICFQSLYIFEHAGTLGLHKPQFT